MPLRDESKYLVNVEGEPKEVREIREKILTSFEGLEFFEEGHKYLLNGEELPSVSTLAGQYEEEFNSEEQAAAYALKHGKTAEYWLDEWRYKNLKATISGTLIHSYAESLGWLHMGHPENITEDNKCKYIDDKGWLIPTRPKEVAAEAFWKEFPNNMYVVLPETKIFNLGDTVKYAGTFDLLLYYKHPTNPNKSGLVVTDWKTNAEIYKSYSRLNGRMLLPPFQKLYAEPFGVYTIQLSLYSQALKKIGLNVIGQRIIWLKDDETYKVVPVDYVGENIKMLDPTL